MTISTAVIIAAGMGTRLPERSHLHPKGFIEIGDRPIVEESVNRLQSVGIARIIIVTGHLAHFYEGLAHHYEDLIEVVHNPDYADTGSMLSVAAAESVINEDFLLLESDILYERRALVELLAHEQKDIVLMSGWTHSGDEVWIETRDDLLVNMSKMRADLQSISGELVGICRISQSLFKEMCKVAQLEQVSNPKCCYETDCLVSVAASYPIYCHKIDDLLWTEIDNATHMRRAIDIVHPQILEVDESFV